MFYLASSCTIPTAFIAYRCLWYYEYPRYYPSSEVVFSRFLPELNI